MNEQRQEQLSRVVIKGFKSIKECELELKNINVLIGANGAGKSNFLSIFELLQNISTQNLSVYAAQRGISSLFYNGVETTDSILLEFYFNNESGVDSHPYTIELLLSDNNNLILHENPAAFQGQLHVPGKPVMNGSVLRPFLKNEWRMYHFHDTSRSSKIKREHNLSNNKLLQWDASNLAAFLFRLRKHYPIKYKYILDTIQLIAPYFRDFELEADENNSELIVLRWLQKGCEDVFNASQLSDGTLRFICLATLLLQPAELQPATIIIDEPELGLHPFAITIFAEMVQKAAVNKQIILATQSVELLDKFSPEDVIVVDRRENGSEFKRLDPEQLAVWLNDDYTLGDLWNKNILGGRFAR